MPLSTELQTHLSLSVSSLSTRSTVRSILSNGVNYSLLRLKRRQHLPVNQTVIVDFGQLNADSVIGINCNDNNWQRKRLRINLIGNFVININRAFGYRAIGVGRLPDTGSEFYRLLLSASRDGNGWPVTLAGKDGEEQEEEVVKLGLARIPLLHSGILAALMPRWGQAGQADAVLSSTRLLPEVSDFLPESQLLQSTHQLRCALSNLDAPIDSPIDSIDSLEACMDLLGAVCRAEKYGCNRVHRIGTWRQCQQLFHLLMRSGDYCSLANPSPWQLGVDVGPIVDERDECRILSDASSCIVAEFSNRRLPVALDEVKLFELGVGLVAMETMSTRRWQRHRLRCRRRQRRLAAAVADFACVAGVADVAEAAGLSATAPRRIDSLVARDSSIAKNAVAKLAAYPAVAMSAFVNYEPSLLIEFFVELSAVARQLAEFESPLATGSIAEAEVRLGRLRACEKMLGECARVLGVSAC